MFTEEEMQALLEEAYTAGAEQAMDDVEELLDSDDLFTEEEDSAFSLEEEMDAYDEALDLRRKLHNVPTPHAAVSGIKGMVSRGGSNFKVGLSSFRKRVLGGANSAKGKFDDARKKLIKQKAKTLLKKKNI